MKKVKKYLFDESLLNTFSKTKDSKYNLSAFQNKFKDIWNRKIFIESTYGSGDVQKDMRLGKRYNLVIKEADDDGMISIMGKVSDIANFAQQLKENDDLYYDMEQKNFKFKDSKKLKDDDMLSPEEIEKLKKLLEDDNYDKLKALINSVVEDDEESYETEDEEPEDDEELKKNKKLEDDDLEYKGYVIKEEDESYLIYLDGQKIKEFDDIDEAKKYIDDMEDEEVEDDMDEDDKKSLDSFNSMYKRASYRDSIEEDVVSKYWMNRKIK